VGFLIFFIPVGRVFLLLSDVWNCCYSFIDVIDYLVDVYQVLSVSFKEFMKIVTHFQKYLLDFHSDICQTVLWFDLLIPKIQVEVPNEVQKPI